MKKLTNDNKKAIYDLFLKKKRSEDIGKAFNVTASTINRIIDRHIKEHGIENRIRPPRKPKNDLFGLFFGQLEVIELILPEKRNPWLYRCKCHACGNENFVKSAKDLNARINPTCGCINWERKKGKCSPFYKGFGEISGSFWNIVKKNAKSRNIKLNVTIEYAWNLYVQQNKKCALSGVDISFGSSNYDETTASLDRINSNEDYVIGNIQWVHKTINFMKHDLSEKDFLYYCKKIIEWNSKN
jgi:hypothetical protein